MYLACQFLPIFLEVRPPWQHHLYSQPCPAMSAVRWFSQGPHVQPTHTDFLTTTAEHNFFFNFPLPKKMAANELHLLNGIILAFFRCLSYYLLCHCGGSGVPPPLHWGLFFRFHLKPRTRVHQVGWGNVGY